MQHRLVHAEGRTYIEVASVTSPLSAEQDATDLVALTWQFETPLLLLPAEAFTDEFFRLKSGLAGAVLQKFGNYGLTVAAVVPGWAGNGDRFRELVLESNKGRTFGVFEERSAAEAWLLK